MRNLRFKAGGECVQHNIAGLVPEDKLAQRRLQRRMQQIVIENRAAPVFVRTDATLTVPVRMQEIDVPEIKTAQINAA